MASINCAFRLELFLAPVLTLCLAFAVSAHEIQVSNESPRQGETVEVTVKLGPPAATSGLSGSPNSPDSTSSSNSPSSAQPPTFAITPVSAVTFNKNCYRLFADPVDPSQSVALLAMPADIKPGKYKLSLGSEAVTLTVLPGQFTLQHIHLASTKDNFIMSPGEKEAVEGAKATLSNNRLWSGAFSPPSRSRTSATFGLRRVVNGKLLPDYFHSGLDFAAPLGSSITACANGKVVLTGTGFRLHGNTVCIDHGQGVVSFYLHMQKILVKDGQTVTCGEKIGTVGQSGRATGPHLHFSVYVNKVAANPSQWFKTGFGD